MLAEEVIRRFSQDVERACRFASATDSQGDAAEIIDAALRWLGPEPSKYFSRELVRVMKVKLGTDAAYRVTIALYLRQFVTEIRPRRLIPYVRAFLDNDMEWEWTAEALHEDEQVVRRRVKSAWDRLIKAIRSEFADADLSERTDGVWTYFKLEQ